MLWRYDPHDGVPKLSQAEVDGPTTELRLGIQLPTLQAGGIVLCPYGGDIEGGSLTSHPECLQKHSSDDGLLHCDELDGSEDEIERLGRREEPIISRRADVLFILIG